MRRLLLLVGAVALAVGVALGTVQLGTSATDQGLLVFASARAEGDYGASADEFPNLFVLRPDGTGLRRLTTVRVADSDPEWSPDGRRIVFSRSAEPYCHGGLCGISLGSDIWVVDASGKNEKALTSLQSLIPGGEVSSTSPTWSPDGSQVAFDRGSPAGSPQDGIYVVGVNGRGLRHVVDYCGDLDCWGASSLDWSPDGKTLAFVAWQRVGEGRR